MMIDSADQSTLEQQQRVSDSHRVSSMLEQNNSATNDSHSAGDCLQAVEGGCNSGGSSGGNDYASGERPHRKVSGCGGGSDDSGGHPGGCGGDSSVQGGGGEAGPHHSPSTTTTTTTTPVGGNKPGLQWSTSVLQSISEEEVMTMMEGRNLQEIMSSMPPCQCDDCMLNEEGDGDGEGATPHRAKPSLKRQSSWKKIRSIVRWSPFIQVFKKHRYPWIQLAGHQGNFQAGEAGCVLKKLDEREHQSLQRLMEDCLQPFVPLFRGVTLRDGEQYIQLQDLLCEFNAPCVMDVKMGVRTFLETEIHAAKQKPTLRKDMYKKMTEVDPLAPTEEERAQVAVTKHRYMQWRDAMSSSANLGFRIEGIKSCDGTSNKDFKKTKTWDDVSEAFRTFFGDSRTRLADYLQRLQAVATTQESSDFFRSHELIGSSLLFVHDDAGAVGVWMIDFGKTQPLPDGVSIDHRALWQEGNHEDGYLLGVDNIISILQDLLAASVE